MVTILQIETATSMCSAAVSVNGATVAVKELSARNIHAGSLTLFIEQVMLESGLKYADLDAVAVSKGPGSYTGLRIGVSTAKGVCFAAEKPLIAIDTLKLMANGFLMANDGFQGLVCPMIDARRMEVFTATYDQHLHEVLSVSAEVIDENAFTTLLSNNSITFIGDGAMKCKDSILSANAAFSADEVNSAANMSTLAFAAFQAGEFEDVAYFEPYYLKDFVITQSKKKV